MSHSETLGALNLSSFLELCDWGTMTYMSPCMEGCLNYILLFLNSVEMVQNSMKKWIKYFTTFRTFSPKFKKKIKIKYTSANFPYIVTYLLLK